MRRLFPLIALAVLRCIPTWADSEWVWAPAGRLFPITFADPREIRTALAFTGRNINASVGSYLSAFAVTPEDESWNFHLGLEGRAYITMRQEGGRFPVETVDGTIGLYTEFATSQWQWQLRYTHVSAHLADGLAGTPIAYSRETVSLRTGYSPDESFQVYAGLYKIVNTSPVVPNWSFQLGTNYFLPWGAETTPFVAADLRWQSESYADPCFALQLGLAFHGAESVRRSLRLYYSYYTGAELRGQFYTEPFTTHAFGIEIPL